MKTPVPSNLSTAELIHKMERTNRQFRIAQSVFMFLAGGMLCVMMIVLFQAQHEFQQQSADRGRAVLDLQKHSDEQNAKQTRYIQCIAQFFATTDRANRTLTDLDSCSIEQNGQPVPGVSITPTSMSVSDSGTSMSPTSSSAAALQPAANDEQGSQPSYAAPAANDPQPAGNPQNPEKPLILDIPLTPVCLPVVAICVR